MTGATVAVLGLAGTLVAGLVTLTGYLLRKQPGSPEQREADTAAFTAATTQQNTLMKAFETRNLQLQTWRDWAQVRMTQLIAWGRAGGGENPPPPVSPEPPN